MLITDKNDYCQNELEFRKISRDSKCIYSKTNRKPSPHESICLFPFENKWNKYQPQQQQISLNACTCVIHLPHKKPRN